MKTLMFITVNGLAPDYPSKKFIPVNTIHKHNVRGSQHNLFIPRSNNEALKKSFRYWGPIIWHSLSDKAKQATCLTSFYSNITS